MGHPPIFQAGEQVVVTANTRAVLYQGRTLTARSKPKPGDHPRYGRWIGHLPLPAGITGTVLPLYGDVMANLTAIRLADGRIASITSWALERA